jgi:hypothetical protein
MILRCISILGMILVFFGLSFVIIPFIAILFGVIFGL